MEEDDDFYASGETTQEVKKSESESVEDNDAMKEEKMDDELEEGEEEESDDSDIDIILDRKDDEPPPQHNRYASIKQEPARPNSTDPSSKVQQQSTASRISTAPTPSAPQKLQDGSKYPEVHTSNVDVNAEPVWEAAGKPITQIDIDSDMAEHTKPWRLPGSDQSDYFNYGFDEFTWASYVIRQQGMAKVLEGQQAETAQFQQMFGGGMPGMPSAPSAPAAQQGGGAGGAGGGGGMPGMPSEQEMMQMMQYMAASGQDPSQMDFNTFMQQANAAASSYGGGQGQGQGNYGNFGNQNQNSGQGGSGGGGRGGRRGRW